VIARGVRIGLAATKAPWSSALRSYVRDHSQGLEVEVIMDRPGLLRALPRIDVLVLDDVMRIFSAPDVEHARGSGVHVIGVSDQTDGLGRDFLARLGVDQVVPAGSPASDLVAIACQAPERDRVQRPPYWPSGSAVRRGRPSGGSRRGLLVAWTKVSGGAGSTEAIIAGAEMLARKSRVIVVEAEEVGPVMASRLLRSPEGGLGWALSQVGQGKAALPGGLSGRRGDGSPMLGRFDAVCGAPGATQVVNATHLEKFLEEALTSYDHVLVETGWLVASQSLRERFSAARAVLRMADAAVVLAGADPEGAARLVQWKAAAVGAGVGCPAWAAFGRARKSRYEQEHLRSLVEQNTGRFPFQGVGFLPEDHVVARARWNAELVRSGRWARALGDLLTSSLQAAAAFSRLGCGSRQVPVPGPGALLPGERVHDGPMRQPGHEAVAW